MKTGQAPVSG